MTAMADAVAECGYEGATVEEVVRRSGLRYEQFHKHFADTEQCFLALYTVSVEFILLRMARAFQREGDWLLGLRAAFSALFVCLAEHPETTRACFSDLSFAGAGPRRAREEALQRFAAFVSLCRAGAPCGAMAPTALDQALAGGLHHVVSSRVRAGRIDDLPELALPMAETVFKCFRGEVPPPVDRGERVARAPSVHPA